jgi:hypothetical protein
LPAATAWVNLLGASQQHLGELHALPCFFSALGSLFPFSLPPGGTPLPFINNIVYISVGEEQRVQALAGGPGFPVELVGVGELHAAFFTESRTREHVWSLVQEIRGIKGQHSSRAKVRTSRSL